jgi:enamine deaminase RidA (YjgF/YER057c/UK114 family)
VRSPRINRGERDEDAHQSAGYPVHPFYSQAVEVKTPERTLYVAGQIGVGSFPSGIAAQTANALNNLVNVLAAADMTPADIAKFTIFLTDADNVDAFGAAAAAALPQPPPAATMVIVKGLAAPEILVEIEAVAAR